MEMSCGDESSSLDSKVSPENGSEAESRNLPSSRFKGVIPQPNGRWGTQIYEKHRRIWLGTFNEKETAARAYDTAAQKFRGRDAVTNFKAVSEDEMEVAFLMAHSKDEIVDMLRKHSYHEELQQSRKNFVARKNSPFLFGFSGGLSPDDCHEQLFEKVVTPSDVGKLNRLVIPKQQAEKHFPLQNRANSKGVLLNFEDTGGKVWRFRYSYWNSSQSYALTKGWSRFVKEKDLRAGYIVCFQRSTGPEKQLFIDWKPRNNVGNPVPAMQMVRLFGVNIFEAPAGDGGSCSGGKRMRGMEEVLGLECSKKHRIINAL